MTAEEILNTITSNGMRELTEARVIRAMEEYGKQQCNEAIEECYSERISIGDGEYVPVERILNLKKP